MLSIIDDTSAAVATRADANGETVRVPSDAAGIALQNSINMPPSLKKNQGSQVAQTGSRSAVAISDMMR